MPELTPGTFLSLLRRVRPAGENHPRQFESSRHRATQRVVVDDPQDCVRRAPSVDADMCQLVGYDIHGNVRIKVEVAEKDCGWWEHLMLRYMRWRFGSPIRLVR